MRWERISRTKRDREYRGRFLSTENHSLSKVMMERRNCVMLKVFFGNMEDAIYFPPVYFDNQYEDDWITDQRSKEMILDVDQSVVVSSHLIDSPVLGPISPRELSGGVKTLILMAFDQSGKIFNASACGDNCAKWILKLGNEKDLTINLRHLMDFGDDSFEIEILNTGKTVRTMLELVKTAGHYV